MASKNGSAMARKIERAGRPAEARSPVGDEITRHLRQLQAERRDELDVDAVVSELVPAISALARSGVLVSVALTPDRRSVRLSALLEKEWVPWYLPDVDEARVLADGIVVTFQT